MKSRTFPEYLPGGFPAREKETSVIRPPRGLKIVHHVRVEKAAICMKRRAGKPAYT
jgi:hypothetical protein